MKVGLKDMKKAYKNVKIDKIEVCFAGVSLMLCSSKRIKIYIR